MIAASEPQEFVPFGREHVRNHPGNVVIPSFRQPLHSESFLAQRFSQVNIDDNPDDEFWSLRDTERRVGVEEELYVSGNTAIVSRGLVGKSVGSDAYEKRAGRVLDCCYTMESPIRQALWCKFTTTVQDDAIVIPSLCILDSTKISVHTSDGEDFLSSLQFKVASAWTTKYGLLLERVSHCNPERTVTDCNYYENLTTLFSLLHPLDEISPILAIRPGGILSYMSDPCLKVVFTSDEPSLCVLYDMRTGVHTIWKIRKALAEECQLMCGTEYGSTVLTPMSGHTTHYSSSANSLHSLKLSKSNIFGQLSTSNSSPYVSRAGSLTGTFYSGSPHPAVHSPSLSRAHSPLCTSPKHSPATSSSIDARLGASQIPNPDPKPIVPGICIEYIWSDTQTVPSDCQSGRAKKVFLMSDVLGQQYLCYLVENRLVCVRLGWTNEKQPEMIIGATSYINAKDAVPVPSVSMVVVLEHNCCVMLYTGTTLVGKLHLAGVSAELASSSYLTCISASHIINSPFPKRSSLLSSTRVGDGVFDEQVHLLSPVGQAYQPKSNHTSSLTDDTICALRDPVDNRFTVEFSNGSMFRFSLPEISSSPLVTECVRVVKHVLQRDVALVAIVKWYSVRNAPGTQDISPKQEWRLFIGALLDLLGYQLSSLPLMMNYAGASDCETSAKNKKRRASDLGSQDDWEYLLGSCEHDASSVDTCTILQIAQLPSTRSAAVQERTTDSSFNSSAPLYPYIHLILFSFHLLYEELKLKTLMSDCLPLLVGLLHQMSSDLRLCNYTDYYWRDYPVECPVNAQYESQITDDDLMKLSCPTFMTDTPPCVFDTICLMLRDVANIEPYPYITSVNPFTRDILELIAILMNGEVCNQVKQVTPPGSRCETPVDMERSPNSDPSLPNTHKAILHMASLGLKQDDLSTMPSGVALVLMGAVQSVSEAPLAGWPQHVYRLIGRLDMIAPSDGGPAPEEATTAPTPAGAAMLLRPPSTSNTRPCLNYHPHTDHTEHTEQVLKLRFSKDQREAEVARLLQSSEPVTIAIQQRPEVSDHEFIEEQERHLYAICTRTMALPVGRGMMELHTATPVVSEPLAIPRLCLSGRAPPRDTTVELSHIEVVPNMNLWPLFHNGVAAGLRIAPDATNVCSTWIAYNKPKNGSEALPEHAGFLMALGLSGHLANFDQLNMYEYLTKCHEMTSVGLLLGIAASKRGTMDVQSTKLFSVHIESLLPPTSIELDLVQNIQVAALLGIGLIYQGTANRHIAEVLLSEIGRPPGPEMDNSCDRECYALAAGLGLGLVVLGRGANPSGLDDLAIADTLHYYMVGGHKRPLTGSQKEKYKSPSYQIREGEYVNNNVTAPGATLALAMMYFNTGNMAVANWLEAPDSEYMLDFVCPDLLLLRTVARGLILWDGILPSKEWVEEHVPPSIRPYCLVKPRQETQESVDYETMNQAYCNIIAGACMAMGLRFAGSANNEAFTTLLYYCKMFTSLSAKSIAELAGKSTIETSINVILLSLAMVMAGTGELEVVRLCRHLRCRVGGSGGVGGSVGGALPAGSAVPPPATSASSSVVTYGSHLVTHMALGLLFLGGGSYSLSTTPESIAALVCAFFPRFPTHSNDNRYHLQALRHLYVLAVEPRLFLPKDIDTRSLCYAHITVAYLDTAHYKDQSVVMYAPCLLPELHLLKQVSIEDNRYWPVVFTRGKNWHHLEEMLKRKGCVGVKQRAGCLPYVDDPHGFRTLLAQSLTTGASTSWSIPTESILAFTSDTVLLNYAKHFLEICDQNRVSTDAELKLMQSLSKLSYECITRDKLPLLRIWIVVLEMVSRAKCRPSPGTMWQLRLVMACGTSRLHEHITTDLVHCLRNTLHYTLTTYEAEICMLICSYLKGRRIVASNAELAKLACYLTFYAVPQQPQISQYFNRSHTGTLSVLDMYDMLKSFNLEEMTVKKIWQLSKLRSP